MEFLLYITAQKILPWLDRRSFVAPSIHDVATQNTLQCKQHDDVLVATFYLN